MVVAHEPVAKSVIEQFFFNPNQLPRGTSGNSTCGTGRAYLVDNSQLQAESPGLGYRCSKRMEDKDDTAFVPWGSTVRGIDQGDGWLGVGNRYLPMRVLGLPVLTLRHAHAFVQVGSDDPDMFTTDAATGSGEAQAACSSGGVVTRQELLDVNSSLSRLQQDITLLEASKLVTRDQLMGATEPLRQELKALADRASAAASEEGVVKRSELADTTQKVERALQHTYGVSTRLESHSERLSTLQAFFEVEKSFGDLDTWLHSELGHLTLWDLTGSGGVKSTRRRKHCSQAGGGARGDIGDPDSARGGCCGPCLCGPCGRPSPPKPKQEKLPHTGVEEAIPALSDACAAASPDAVVVNAAMVRTAS